MISVLKGTGHLKAQSVLWSDGSTFQTVFGKHCHCVLWAKEEKKHLDCYQHEFKFEIYD